MNKQPSYYRARFEAFAKAISYELSLPESKQGRMRIAYLRNGIEPTKYLREGTNYYNFKLEEIGSQSGSKSKSGGIFYFPSIEQYTKELEAKNQSNEQLTELEIHTLDTYFVLYPEKVCGVQTCATGYSFPIKTIGSIDDVKNAIDKTLSGGAVSKKKKEKPAFEYKFKKGDKVKYKNAKIEATIIEPITAPTDELLEAYNIKFDDGLVQYAYADDLVLIKNKQPDWLFIGVYPTGEQYADRTINERGDFKKIAFVFNEPQYNWDNNDVTKATNSYRVEVESNDKKYAELIADLQNKFDLPLQQKPAPQAPNKLTLYKYKAKALLIKLKLQNNEQ